MFAPNLKHTFLCSHFEKGKIIIEKNVDDLSEDNVN